VLDVGCGGGRTIHKLAALATEGKVCGVDYSPVSVASSKHTNKALIDHGRVEIQQGSVSQLPFSDRMFDIVTAVETHYYWPDLAADFREVLRVLKPGGKLIVIAELYKGGKFDLPSRLMMKTLRAAYLSPAEFSTLFRSAGFANVEVFEESRKGWICGVASRPS
jgi:ubiquinone/menaquinone biosynthesis C-methylase UbiE